MGHPIATLEKGVFSCCWRNFHFIHLSPVISAFSTDILPTRNKKKTIFFSNFLHTEKNEKTNTAKHGSTDFRMAEQKTWSQMHTT